MTDDVAALDASSKCVSVFYQSDRVEVENQKEMVEGQEKKGNCINWWIELLNYYQMYRFS